MSLNINKQTGDVLTANEFMQVVNAVNANERSINEQSGDVEQARADAATAKQTATVAKQTADEVKGQLSTVVADAAAAGAAAANAAVEEVSAEMDAKLGAAEEAVEAAKEATDAALAGTITDGTCTVGDESAELALKNRSGEAVVTVNIPTGSAKGGNTWNATVEVPLTDGYHSLGTAAASVPTKRRTRGLCVTWEDSAGKWVTKQFAGEDLQDWTCEDTWTDFGNGSKVKGIALNGQALSPNSDGLVNIPIDTVEVDESLDATSTNAVSNAAATQAINELKNGVGSGLDADIDSDAGTVTLKLTDKTGRSLSEVELPMGSGGSGDGTVSKIVIAASVDHALVKEGGQSVLTWRYDHVDGEGVSDGVKATVEITVRRGTTQTYNATIQNVAPGTSGTLDLTDYLLAGTVDIYVRASCTTAEGTPQTKQAYTTVQVVTLNLTSTFDISASLQKGGYQSESVEVPFAITGSGTKTVILYVDGVQRSSKTISRSGTTNDAFTIDTTGMAAGRHNIQMVAERDGLLSDSLWLDFLVAGGEDPWIGLRITFKDGRIYQGDYKPVIDAEQYGQFTLDFAAWNPESTTSDVTVTLDGVAVSNMNVARQLQQWTTRLMEGGRKTVELSCGETTYQLFLAVTASSLDVGEATQGLLLKLTASGRSNSETGRGDWGGVTTMNGVDFKSSGWFQNALLLRNGASASINHKPFGRDATGEGLTVIIEYRASNVMDRTANIISCMETAAGKSYGKGFAVKAGEMQLFTGETKMVDTPDQDDEGNTIQRERPIGVSMEVASDEWLTAGFVIHNRSTASTTEGNSLMCLYINGVLSKVDQYTGDFMQEEALPISIDSTWADVEVRSVYVYGRALSSDEMLGNWIVARQTAQEMVAKYTANAVLGTDGKVSADILRSRGRGVMVIVPESSVLDAVAANDKKKDFTASKTYWYSPYGEQYDFVAENNYFRLQGTSSTKYPRKNWRIYLAKGPEDGASTRLYVGSELVNGRKYALRPGESVPMNLFCMKADYSDSSMVMNTGGAKLFDQIMRDLDLLTPPQRWQKDHGQTVTIRQAIDGIPCDLFVADRDGGELTYYGQYNLNNEKAKSGKLFGMEGVDGYEPECPLAFEALNNGSEICLFQSKGSADSSSLETQLQSKFDDGFEFNFPEDVYYNTAKAASKGGTVATAEQKSAVKRLFGWLYDVTPVAMRYTPDYGTSGGWEKSKWISERFKAEAREYFDVTHLLTYYLFTDYWASVDQRAKNILWRTWDGLKWWATYYDGDTAQSIRNDAFMAYLYNITRDTWDAEASKWAFEGHDSWLWCLVLANFEEELREAASALRAKLTDARQLEMFNGEQMGNWCERLYNESGWFKYVQPLLEGVVENGQVKKYNYLYGLTGNRESHRTAFLTQRGALLDARYGTTTYQSDRITFYASRKAGDAADTVRIKSGDLYYYGYRTNNGDFLDGPTMADKGETASLTFEGTLALNDPLNLCGASRITELDWRDGPSCGGNFELQACRMLRVLNMSNERGTQMQTSLVLAGLSTCIQMEQLILTGQQGVSSGGGGLDLSAQTKLKVLIAGGTGLSTVTLAEGAPVETLVLPPTLTRLRLRYLPLLQNAGLTLQGYGSITRFEFAECPGLDWSELLGNMVNVRYIRVEGLSGTVDVNTLERFRTLGAVKADGTVTNDYCGLVGEVEASQYIDDDLYAEYQLIYPELTIRQPEYTVIEFDDNVSDDANVSNLDNRTGYKFGNDYVPSGHIASLLKQRHRVLAKITKMPSSRAITHAGVDTQQNNVDGEMTYYPLHDANSNYYADAKDVSLCTEAKLDSTEGDWMMLEPHRWTKGVNDYLNLKHYSCYSIKKESPSIPDVTVLTLADIQTKGSYMQGYKVMTGKETLSGSYSADSSYSVCRVSVEGYKRVRFPSVPGTNLVGAVFVDANGLVISSVIVPTLGLRFESGMYLIADVPEGAASLVFSILNSADFDKVVLDPRGERIEDMEPEWVETEEYLCAVVGSTAVGDKLRACIGGGSTVASMTWTDFHYYSQKRGMQQIDGLMHNDIGNLFFAKYGRRDSQKQCGAGSNTNSRTTGLTAKLGMQDTVNTDGTTVGGVDGNGLAFYPTVNELGPVSFTRINNTNCLGYENIYGHKYDMMDCVDVPNSSGKSGRWRYRMPDGTERWVKGATLTLWIAGVAHGLYMDLVPVGTMGGSSTTYYCDYFNFSGSAGRVVYRGNDYAYAHGGVSYATAVNDASNSHTYVGSRLAFRGKIVKASSVAAYKSAVEVA